MIDYSFFPSLSQVWQMTAFSDFLHKIWIWQMTALQSQLQNFIKLTKTDDRYKLFFVSFWRILSMTDDSFSTFVTQNLTMTDVRWQLFLCLSPSFLLRQMTAFFYHVCDFWQDRWQIINHSAHISTMTDDNFKCSRSNCTKFQ